jgi:hypothetical protein
MEVLQKRAEEKTGEWKTAECRGIGETVSRGVVPYIGKRKNGDTY